MPAKLPRLTKHAQQLLELAQDTAARQGRDEIDTEDLLFGMVSIQEITTTKDALAEAGQFLWLTQYDLTAAIHQITGWVELLHTAEVSEEERVQFLGHIRKNANDASMRLQYARTAAAKLTSLSTGAKKVSCNVKDQVNQVVNWDGRMGPHQSIKVVFDIPDGRWQVLSHYWLVEDTGLCLIRIGKARSPIDKPVTISLNGDDEGVWLRVKDLGSAIPDNLVEQLKTQHSRFDEIGEALLPLTVLTDLIKGQTERFEARNLPEGGAEFAVLFPSAIVISAGEDAPNNPTHP